MGLWVEHDPVVVLGLLDRDVAVLHVLDDRLDRALVRVAPAAAGARDEPRHLALLQQRARGLADNDLAPVLVEDVNGVARAVAAAVDPPRHEFVTAEGGGDRDAVDRGAVVADAAAPAPVPAGAGIGRVERELVDDDPVAGLGDGETYLIPIEVAEARYGIVVDQFALDPTEAGAGRHRGGRGCIREYRAAVDGVTITATFGRHKYVPWGIAGGRDGSRNAVHILYQDGREVVVGKTARTLLQKGEVARLVTGTGGGWGNPLERPVAAVVEDVKDGYVTVEQAERDYGVVIDADTYEVVEVRR